MIAYTYENFVAWSRMGSRYTFGQVINEIAGIYPDFVVMAGDVAHSANLEDFKNNYPQRFFNIGIAEQNLLAMAAGMAREGIPVFAVSFAPFVSMRAFEAVRTYIGYMNLDVKIVGLASGVSMGVSGNTHYGLEDVALMRTIPNMTILSPADCTETAKSIIALTERKGPSYLRLTGINGNPIVYKEDYEFELDKSVVLREGNDVALIASGTMVNECLRAARALGKDGISCFVVNMHTIKPLDVRIVKLLCDSCKLIATVEEHHTAGGLGGAIAEYISAKTKRPPQLIIGIDDIFPHAGDYSYVLKECGLTAQDIVLKVKAKYNNM